MKTLKPGMLAKVSNFNLYYLQGDYIVPWRPHATETRIMETVLIISEPCSTDMCVWKDAGPVGSMAVKILTRFGIRIAETMNVRPILRSV